MCQDFLPSTAFLNLTSKFRLIATPTPILTSKLRSNPVNTQLNLFPLPHSHRPVHFPLIRSPIMSVLPSPERQSGTAQEPSSTKISLDFNECRSLNLPPQFLHSLFFFFMLQIYNQNFNAKDVGAVVTKLRNTCEWSAFSFMSSCEFWENCSSIILRSPSSAVDMNVTCGSVRLDSIFYSIGLGFKSQQTEQRSWP